MNPPTEDMGRTNTASLVADRRITKAESDRLKGIYREAAQLICEKGFDATSMNEIAEAVGLTKAGLYHHISGKRALLSRIIGFGLDSLEELVITPAREVNDAERRLRTIISNHVHLITGQSTPKGNNPVIIVLDDVAGLTPGERRKVDERKRKYVDLIRDTLLELKSEGKLMALDVTAAAFGLLGMITWLSRWYNPEGRLSPDQISDEITKMALSAVLKPATNYLEADIPWVRSGDPSYPYSAVFKGEELVVRLNDFPDEILYTLIVNGNEVVNLDSWPDKWARP